MVSVMDKMTLIRERAGNKATYLCYESLLISFNWDDYLTVNRCLLQVIYKHSSCKFPTFPIYIHTCMPLNLHKFLHHGVMARDFDISRPLIGYF